MQCQFCDALAGCTATGRGEGVAGTFLFRSSAEAEGPTTEALGRFAVAGSQGPWLWHQSVDHGSYCRGDPACFWDSVSPRPCRSFDAQLAVESAETGAACAGAGRRSDSMLERKRLAAH